MRYLTNILVCLIFLNCFYNYTQETSAFVKDSLTEKSIPFASIYIKSGDGAVTNEEGYFRLKTNTLQEKDSIYERSVMICSKNADRGAFNLNRIKKLTKAKAVAEAENHPRHSVLRGF